MLTVTEGLLLFGGQTAGLFLLGAGLFLVLGRAARRASGGRDDEGPDSPPG